MLLTIVLPKVLLKFLRARFRRIQTNKVRNSFALLLRDLRQDLHKLTNLKWIDYSLLVALAFIDDELVGNQRRFDTFESQYSTDEYLEMAKKVLDKKPELKKLGKMITKHLRGKYAL